MSKAFSFPNLERQTPLSRMTFRPDFEAWARAFVNSYCPVCGVFAAPGEMHFSNAVTGQCARIVNIGEDSFEGQNILTREV